MRLKFRNRFYFFLIILVLFIFDDIVWHWHCCLVCHRTRIILLWMIFATERFWVVLLRGNFASKMVSPLHNVWLTPLLFTDQSKFPEILSVNSYKSFFYMVKNSPSLYHYLCGICRMLFICNRSLCCRYSHFNITRTMWWKW